MMDDPIDFARFNLSNKFKSYISIHMTSIITVASIHILRKFRYFIKLLEIVILNDINLGEIYIKYNLI